MGRAVRAAGIAWFQGSLDEAFARPSVHATCSAMRAPMAPLTPDLSRSRARAPSPAARRDYAAQAAGLAVPCFAPAAGSHATRRCPCRCAAGGRHRAAARRPPSVPTRDAPLLATIRPGWACSTAVSAGDSSINGAFARKRAKWTGWIQGNLRAPARSWQS